MYKTRLYYTTEPQNKDVISPSPARQSWNEKTRHLVGGTVEDHCPQCCGVKVVKCFAKDSTNTHIYSWAHEQREKTLELQGASSKTGRLFSGLRQVPGSSVGKKGLKIKASCVWQFRATYLFDFRGSTAFLGLFTKLCFQYCVLLMCNFFFSNSHGGKKSSLSVKY